MDNSAFIPNMIALDADDTLWHNEHFYQQAELELARLLRPYYKKNDLSERLFQTETRNIAWFGYGIKSFTLSMVQTAVELSGGRLGGAEVLAILELGKQMLAAPVELMPHTLTVLHALAGRYPLMLITKGDLLEQNAKIERSGLRKYFQVVEVVSEKTPAAYAVLLQRHNLASKRFMMVGNSVRSDILPVIELGGVGVHIPYATTWAHERAEPPREAAGRFYELEHLGLLPDLIKSLSNSKFTQDL